MVFKTQNKLLVPLVLVLLFSTYEVTRGADWSAITGSCRIEKEVILKAGTRVKMFTEKSGKVMVEETALKRDRRGILMSCDTGVYAQLQDCGNLVMIAEKPKVEKIIEREPVYIDRPVVPEPVYVDRPVYIDRPVPEPVYVDRPVYIDRPIYTPAPIYAPAPIPVPVPLGWVVVKNYHYHRPHHWGHPGPRRPDPPVVNTLPARVHTQRAGWVR